MADSVYIHIPFCKSKCKYCSFVSFPCLDKKNGYVFSLFKEIDTNYNGESLKTLYFGGGTPSLIEIEYLKKLIKMFNFNSDCEITLELNPDDATYDYLSSLFDIGINRLSIGSQTFDNDILKLIGRRHCAEQTINTVNLAQKIGFNNINIDLIYGLPQLNLNNAFLILKNDLNKIINLGIPHVSTYGLKIEENSFFYKNIPANLPDDDMQADMYLEINDYLEKNDLNRYEISNFALSGFESKHNLNYWNNDEYYGFGVSAHGYIDGIRYSNFNTLEEYMNNPTQHQLGHVVTEQEKLEEEIFLGFRKTCGIDKYKINQKFNIDFDKKYEQVLNKYSPKYIELTDVGYKLTTDGILLSTNILADFL